MSLLAKSLTAITRLYPFFKGRGRLALSSFGRTRTRQSDAVVASKLKSGEVIYINPNDYIGRMVYFFGDLDPSVTQLVQAILKDGNVLIDVGANIGIETLVGARGVGASGKVFSIEPVSDLTMLLTKSLEANGFKNVNVINKAVSDKPGVASLIINSNDYGRTSLGGSSAETTCLVTTLDDICRENGVANIRLLKIDVEGFEASVLEGASYTLKNNTPNYILFESHPERGAFLNRKEVRILHQNGYELFGIFRGVFCKPVLRKSVGEPTTSDFLAKHSTVTEQLW